MTSKKGVKISIESLFTPIHSPPISPLLNPINVPSLYAYLNEDFLDLHEQRSPVPEQTTPVPEQTTPIPEQRTPSPLETTLIPLDYSSIAMNILSQESYVSYLDSSISLSTIPEEDEENCETPILMDKSHSVD